MTVRRPRLLGSGFAEQNRLEPSEFSLTLPLRDVPSASMTLPDEINILTHQWMELFTARGSAGLFRVTDIEHGTGGETSVTLRHGIDTLSDDLWTAAQTDYSGTVSGFLGELMRRQTVARWQLGTCEDNANYKKNGINYTRLSDLFAGLINDRNDYYTEYDFSTTPWTINWRALPSAVSAEFRLSRNVESATVSRSDADMCNRLYLSVNTGIVENGVNVNTATYSTYNDTASQAIYGVIARFEDIDTEGVASISDWVNAYFAKRSAPAVQITIDGLELAALTGDTWDEFDRGRMVRAILTDMGETVNERVECVSYPDVLGEPERVEVELANRLDTFTKSMAKVSSTASSASYESREVGRSSARGSQLSGVAGRTGHIELVVTETKLEELYQSGIVIDADEGVTIFSLEQGFQSQYAAIQVHSGQIQSIVTDQGTMQSSITQNANRIALVVDENGIKTASIVTEINDSGSNVTIDADKILLSGTTTLDTFFSGSGYTGTINTGTLNAGTISMNSQNGYFYYQEKTWNARQLQMNNIAGLAAVYVLATGTGVLNFTHAHELTVDSSGNVTCGLAVSQNSSSATFNMAATAYFQNAVAAAKQSVSVTADGFGAKNGGSFRAYGVAYRDGVQADSDHRDYAVGATAETVSGNPLGVSIKITVTIGSNASYSFTTTV